MIRYAREVKNDAAADLLLAAKKVRSRRACHARIGIPEKKRENEETVLC